MEPRLTEDRVKPFRLVKYFAYTGLVVIFLVTVILSVLNTHWVKSMQRKKSEDYAHVMIENLNHQIFIQFIIPVGLMFNKIQLSNRQQFERMDQVVRSTMHSFKAETVNIYSMDNEVSYSFDKYLIGRKNYGGTGYLQAKSGKWNSFPKTSAKQFWILSIANTKCWGQLCSPLTGGRMPLNTALR